MALAIEKGAYPIFRIHPIVYEFIYYFILTHLTQGCREGNCSLLIYTKQQLTISRIVEILTTG